MAVLTLLPGDYDIEVTRGDSLDFIVTVKEGPEGAEVEVDLTGATVRAWVKRTARSRTAVCSFECTPLPDQVTNRGQIQIVGRDDETSKLASNRGVWDLEVRHAPSALYPEGRVRTYLGGKVKVRNDVTGNGTV